MPAQSGGSRVRERRGSRRSPRLGRWGSLRGRAGVGIIAGGAALGTVATIAMRAQPGQVLGGCVVVATVAAALAVRPQAGRLIFPVPALSYLIAALIAGIVYNRSASKTELAIGATQWIANGFFLMALATVLAIATIVARWYLGTRGSRGAEPPLRDREDDRAGFGGTGYPPPRPSRPQPGPQPGPRPRGPAGPGPYPDQRNGRYPGQRYGSGPYNFSSGA
jgi:hypothetical protein